MFLITCCGRSGSKFTSTLLNKLGIDVGHEKLGLDGDVGYKRLLITLFGNQSLDIFDNIYHQIRHPVDAINSLQIHRMSLLESLNKATFHPVPVDPFNCTPEQKIWLCMNFWYEWNRMCEYISSESFTVEGIGDNFDRFCELTGAKKDKSIYDSISKMTNHRPDRLYTVRVTVELMYSLDAPLTDKIIKYASKFGYEV